MAVLSLAYGRESRIRALRAARLQTQLAEAQLHALGAQLQPHFLFNTLHMISALVRHDPKRAEQLIARLSDLLREMLDNGERVEVSLAEELAFLEKYIEIQEARFGPRLQVHFEIAPSVRSARVPRLVLQPLLENAIRHGIARRSEPGTVVIGAAIADGLLVMTVRDDGVGVPQSGPAREGVGLSSTRARLLQLYGSASRFTIAPADGGGTLCTIHIPCFGADGASA
jgi:LytS/YehU family sensor histidine kinase